MITVPGMLMVGAAGRNAGKTEFACSLIRKFSLEAEITGVKVTAIRERGGACPRGGQGCGVCSSLEGEYCITEENGENPDKDTARLLAAGAKRVFWLRVLKEHLAEGLAALGERLGSGAITVCESNSLRLVAEPDIFIIVKEKGSEEFKPSSRDVLEHADRVVPSDGKSFDIDLDDIRISGRRWGLRAAATAVIMAGGGSTRMGRDKSLLPVRGRPMIEHVYEQLKPHFKEVLISAADPGKYSFLDARVVPDETPGQGPLMGIACALPEAKHDLVAVVACDIPDVNIGLLKRMLRLATGFDAVIPRSGPDKYEPLFAIYRKSAAAAAREVLAAGKRRIIEIFERCKVRFVDLEGRGGVPNINTIEDYEQLTRERNDTV